MAFRVFTTLALGCMELAAAITLVLIGYHLPGPRDVERTFGSAREMAQATCRHIRSLEGQTDVVQDGARGLHQAMSNLAGGFEVAADLKYPVITLDGVRPTVKWHALWPDGPEAAARFRKVTAAARQAESQVAALSQDLPQIRENLEEMDAALAQYGRQTAQALWYSRLLMWLVAAITGLHAAYLLIQTKMDAQERVDVDGVPR